MRPPGGHPRRLRLLRLTLLASLLLQTLAPLPAAAGSGSSPSLHESAPAFSLGDLAGPLGQSLAAILDGLPHPSLP